MKKVCPKCKSELRAVVHATYEFDGVLRGLLTDVGNKHINSIMCSECDFMRVKSVHNLEPYFNEE